MEPFQVAEIISDVACARADLAHLSLDVRVTPERLAKCEAVATNLKTIVGELLTEAWVPRDPAELVAAIQCVHKNIEHVQADVAAALDVVLQECRPDELYRVWCAMSSADLLKFELDVMMTALAHSMMCSCGCRGFVAEEWAN